MSYNNILYAAAELSGGYTRDKIPATVAVMLHAYLTDSIRDVWRRKHASTWPELLTLEEVTLTDGSFTNDLGTSSAEAIIVAVYDRDPRGSGAAYKRDFENAGGTVYVETDETTVYVEWMDYPPNYTNMTQGQRDAATVLERMAGWLIHSGASKLARADGREQMANVQLAIANAALKREVDEAGAMHRHATVLRQP